MSENVENAENPEGGAGAEAAAGPEAPAGSASPEAREPRDLIVSVRVPFCRHPCDVYDADVVQAPREKRAAYQRALLREVESLGEELADYRLRALRFDGGIPTILDDMGLPEVVRAVERSALLADDFELTVATGPGCIGINVLSRLRDLRLSRIDFLLASAVAYELDVLDYRQTPGDLYVSRQILEFGKLDNLGVEVMAGLPGQTPASMDATIDQALYFAPTVFIVTPFSLKPGSALYRRIVVEGGRRIPHVNNRTLPDGEARAEIAAHAEERLLREGYRPFAPGRYALPGREGLYERLAESGVERMGVGLGGVSVCGGFRVENTSDLDAYIAGAGDPARTVAKAERL